MRLCAFCVGMYGVMPRVASSLIAIIDHTDLDRVAAEALVECDISMSSSILFCLA